MKATTCMAVSLALTVSLMTGCSGSDSQPTLTNAPAAGVVDDQRTPESDALTPQESALVNQAESEPVPAPRVDI
jgi:hypothetical protein